MGMREETLLDINSVSADKKFENYCSLDPFPEIAPALLNGADVIKYANQVGLLDPFEPTKQMNGVTYEVNLKGKVRYWYYDDKNNELKEERLYLCKKEDENGIKDNAEKLKIESELVLKPNSITYITLEPMFRMPLYMVGRFNLKVKYAYAGLLLGTGPIVDPGFVGRLSIPLHNLTTNDIILYAGKELIAIEFTKMSRNVNWDKSAPHNDKAPSKEFTDGNTEKRDVFYYTERALKEIKSKSIISDAPSQFRKLKKEIDRIKTQAYGTIIVLFLSMAGFVLGLFWPTLGLVKDVGKERTEHIIYRLESKSNQAEIKKQINQLENDLTNEKTLNAIQQEKLDALKIQITDLNQQINNMKPKPRQSQ